MRNTTTFWRTLGVATILTLALPGAALAQEYTIAIAPAGISEATTTSGAVKVTVTQKTTATAVAQAVGVFRLPSSDAEEDGVTPGEDDYTLTSPSTTVFDAVTATGGGIATRVWTVTMLNDGVVEGPEDLHLGLYVKGTVPGTAYTSAPVNTADLQSQVTLTIEDDDSPAANSLRLTGANTTTPIKESATETARKIKLTVSQPAGLTFTEDQVIDLVFGGDAAMDEDYMVKDERLILEAGDTKVETDLTILDDMVYDGPVRETIRVSAFVGNVQLGGSAGTRIIAIEDNEQDPEGFEVEVDEVEIAEGEVATLTVTAEVNLTAPQTFMLTAAGTATENTDYTIPSTLTIAKDTKTGSVQLRAVTDAEAEADETVMITVMAGGVMIGSVQTVTITGDADAADPTDEPEEEETDEPEEEETDESEEEETDESEEERVRLPKVEYTATAGDASIMVSWTAVEGAASYQVGWSKDTQAETANSYFTVRDGLSYTIENLANGTAYAVWLNARDEDGYGGEGSRPVVVTPMAAAEMPTPTPALPLFGAFALGAGLLAAGRARVRRQAQLRGREQRRQLTR